LTVEKGVIYLKPGAKGTERLVEAVAARVREGGVSGVVVASNKGKTALSVAEALKDLARVVSVTEFTYDGDLKKSMKKLGVASIERAELPIQDRREMREALQMFGGGAKAALEVASVAAEKGLASGKVVAVAGGRGGLDTALVVRPCAPADFSNPNPSRRMAVLEVIALPLQE
jgi:hypothetical protein